MMKLEYIDSPKSKNLILPKNHALKIVWRLFTFDPNRKMSIFRNTLPRNTVKKINQETWSPWKELHVRHLKTSLCTFLNIFKHNQKQNLQNFWSCAFPLFLKRQQFSNYIGFWVFYIGNTFWIFLSFPKSHTENDAIFQNKVKKSVIKLSFEIKGGIFDINSYQILGYFCN